MFNPTAPTSTHTAADAPYPEEENNDIWQPMTNHHRLLYEHTNTLSRDDYHFEPINHDFSIQSAAKHRDQRHSIQRPVPISSYSSQATLERSRRPPQQYGLPSKRNSTVNVNPSRADATMRSYGLPRSMTSDQLASSNTNHPHTKKSKLYSYPSVQDVLDALEQRSFDKESLV